MAGPLAENAQIVPAFIPVDMQTGANDGDWVNMSLYEYCTAILYKAVGTAGDDPVFKLQQAQDNAGTGAKDINFTDIHSKLAVDITTVGTYTKTTQTAATSYTDATSAEKAGIIQVTIRAENLDVDNGFTHIQLSVADTGSNAQLGCGLYILEPGRFSQATLPSAID